jgi:limonene-1,2-epoxide hydrolase
MTGSFRPRILHDAAAPPSDPQTVVESFLAALAAPDLDTAASLLDEHVAYANAGLPTVRGRRTTLKVLKGLAGPISLEVYLHAIAANGPTVLTERTDVLCFGRLRIQLWVNGRFDVQGGKITFWRDSFDYLDALRAFGRGLLGAVIPVLRPAPPGSPDVTPGRH